MTLAAAAFHAVASSIGAWRRDVRRYARVARAGCNVAPLSGVRRPLPMTLFGDALMSLCGDRLRSALETPYVAASNSHGEREPRPRMPDAPPRTSASKQAIANSTATNGLTTTPSDWRATGEHIEERDAAASRADVIPRRDRSWTPGAERDESASDGAILHPQSATTTARTARGRDEQGSVSTKRDAPSPLAVALQRLQRIGESSTTVTPTTRPTAPPSQHDAVVSRETSHAEVTQRSPSAQPAGVGSTQHTGEHAHLVQSASPSVAGRQPWWASGVDEIHSRNVPRAPVARPATPTTDAPEEAFAEMLADVLRQQAIQHGVLVP